MLSAVPRLTYDRRNEIEMSPKTRKKLATKILTADSTVGLSGGDGTARMK